MCDQLAWPNQLTNSTSEKKHVCWHYSVIAKQERSEPTIDFKRNYSAEHKFHPLDWGTGFDPGEGIHRKHCNLW